MCTLLVPGDQHRLNARVDGGELTVDVGAVNEYALLVVEPC
jgi:hypothetical protein